MISRVQQLPAVQLGHDAGPLREQLQSAQRQLCCVAIFRVASGLFVRGGDFVAIPVCISRNGQASLYGATSDYNYGASLPRQFADVFHMILSDLGKVHHKIGLRTYIVR